jgi:MerR family copper efflux transcriptional regulator
MPAMDRITIGALAKSAGVGIDTVRFYERAGLLPRPARTAAGYRLYAPADVARVRFIRRAKDLGFTLEEIAELLVLARGGSRARVRALAAARLTAIESRIADLVAMRDALRGLTRRCHGDGTVEGCPIIDAVLGAGAAPAPLPAPTAHRALRRTAKKE